MIIRLPIIVPSFIEYDIFLLGGYKKYEQYYFIRYFDFAASPQESFHPLKAVHPWYTSLVARLSQYAQRNQYLFHAYTTLALRMHNKKREITFSEIELHTHRPKAPYMKVLDREEWQYAEKLLQKIGLTIRTQSCYHAYGFELPRKSAKITLISQNTDTFLEINAPAVSTIDTILSALGQSREHGQLIEETSTDSAKYRPNKNARDRHGT